MAGCTGLVQHFANPVDFAHRLGDLAVTAVVVFRDGHGEGFDRLAPQFIHALFAAVMFYIDAQFQRLGEAIGAFPHQFVVAVDVDSVFLQIHDGGENVGGPIEQRTGQHGGVNSLAPRVGFIFPRGPGFLEFFPRRIDAGFGVMESAAGERIYEFLFGGEGLRRRLIVANPVIIIKNMRDAISVPDGAVFGRAVHNKLAGWVVDEQ